MKKYVCTVCGYIAEGSIPEQCPVCKAPASAFVEKTGNTYVTEHVVGIGKAEGVPQEIVDGLRANFEGECSEVGMYLAMARVAEREGYPEIAEAYKRYAYEEADHASRFAELLGEVVTDSTKKNLMMRGSGQEGKGPEPGCNPRYRPRDGKGRGTPWPRLRGPAEALLQRGAVIPAFF